jgi:hypothetical protein
MSSSSERRRVEGAGWGELLESLTAWPLAVVFLGGLIWACVRLGGY